MQFPRQLIPPVIAGLLVTLALLGLIGTAIRDPRPHDIPVGLVGPPAAVQQVTTSFGTNAPGTFAFTSYSSESDASAALDSRAVDGVVILGPSPRLIVAGAAGDAETGVITAAFTNAFQAQGTTVAVATVHPFAAGDGAGLIVVLVDLVSSGGPVGSQLLPDLYRAIAPWMPAGSLYSGMRGALYFGGAGTGGPIVVLTAWLVGGVILLWLGGLRSRATNR